MKTAGRRFQEVEFYLQPAKKVKKKERNDTHSEKGRKLGDRVVKILQTHHQGLGADLQSPLPKFLQALRMREDILQKLKNGVCVLFRAHIDVHGQVLAF